MTRLSHFAWLVALGLAATEPAPAAAGARDHEDGFLLRLSGGVGYAESDAAGRKLSGTSGDINFAFGLVLSPNFAVHATLLQWTVRDPDLQVGSAKTKTTGRMSIAGGGAGMTYYFMPHNFYLSPSVGVGRMDFDDGHTDLGLISDVSLGKEWWISPSWGLGVAAGAGYHLFHDDRVDDHWNGVSFVLRFSATAN